MIDQRINNSLKELEQSLQNIESARKQVERTVGSYDGLNNTTSEYVSTLSTLTIKVKELISSIDTDYKQKISSFEKDRKTIIEAANAASQKLSDATDSFQNSLGKLETRLKYSLIFNGVTLFALAVVLFMLLK